jgi:hypothetical protein
LSSAAPQHVGHVGRVILVGEPSVLGLRLPLVRPEGRGTAQSPPGRDRAELLRYAHHVPIAPAFDDPAVGHAVDHHPGPA